MKTPKQLKITKTQFKNLAKLITFVRAKVAPPKFDITSFHSEENDTPSEAVYNHCGTTACFCGYGPLAGIQPRKHESWFDYARRNFGAECSWFTPSELFDLLFSEDHKNSKVAACKRGAYFLQNGLPESDSLNTWETPRSFIPEWDAIAEIAKS